MADVAIDSAVYAITDRLAYAHDQCGPFWTTEDIGYVFYLDASGPVVYRKTADAGATWGAAVTVEAATCQRLFAIAEWEELGSGTLIHIAWQSDADDTEYRTLDTATDTLGTKRTPSTTMGTTGALNYNESQLSMCKAAGGNLYIWTKGAGGSGQFLRSTDAGANWTARSTAVWESDNEDRVYLIRGASADTNDICALFMDDSGNALTIKFYDDSANTWGSETAVVSVAAVDWPDAAWGFDVAIRQSDDKALVACWNDYDSATADLKTIEVSLDSAAAGSTVKTDVISNTGESFECAIAVDNNTDEVAVHYIKGGTLGATTGVYRKRSTDGMATWGSETKVSEDTDDDIKRVFTGHGIPSGSNGRFYAIWFNSDTNALMGGSTNSVEITAGAGGGATFTPRMALLGVG